MQVLLRTVALALLIVLVGAIPVWASSQTLTLSDPAGDTADLSASTMTPAYMDMVSASIIRTGPDFEFSMTLRAPIPNQPALPRQVKEIRWIWMLDTDRTTFPAGYPLPPGQGHAVPPEFMVIVAWDGSLFRSYLADRRPLLTGSQAIFTPVSFTSSGTQLTASVDAVSVGDPQTFGVRMLTVFWLTSSQAANGFAFADVLPNAAPPFVEWPAP
ncbi:MAG: hypothetical protein ABI797_03805 [Chloroflexota bacterium]